LVLRVLLCNRALCAVIGLGRIACCEIHIHIKEQPWGLPGSHLRDRFVKLVRFGGNDFGPDPESRLDEIRENQQIINLQGSSDVAAAACDAVVRRLCLGLWRFIGIKSENNAAS
jgi:hypothetical protein